MLGAQCAAQAGDIANEIKDVDEPSLSENGGFLELGVVLDFRKSAFEQEDVADNDDVMVDANLSISAGYRYKRVFIEATESGFDGLNFGVTLLERERWTVDMLLANIAGNITVESDEPPPPMTEAERNQAILDRDSLFIAAGTRVTGYFGESILQFRVVSDWYDGNGLQGSARVGRQWQLGNWKLQGIVGARVYSQRFSNYLFGISTEEESLRFPAYRAGSAVIPEGELALTIPLSKNWVYVSRLGFRSYPGSVTSSPLIANSGTHYLNAGFHYVF